MATVTVASSNPSFSHSFFTLDSSLPGPGRPREASFSSYLSAADESFSLRLSGEFTDHLTAASLQATLGSGRKKVVAAAEAQDDELDVFGAEKYFSGGMDGGDELEKKSEKTWTASPLKEPEPVGRRTRPGTPSTCSEASANSRSLLLRDSRSDRSRNIPPRPHPGSKKFLGIIFPCSCSDGSSVEVDKSSKESDSGGFPASRQLEGPNQARRELWCNEETFWRRANGTGGAGAGFATKREDYFSFPPVLNPVVVGNSPVAAKVLQEEQKLARVSLMDVFGASFLGKKDITSSLRRSLTIMSPFAGTGAGAAARADDDACSEASSDLFEIESLSTSMVPLSGAGGTSASTTCYEPSEASIEWSVVTASAANFSMASDGEVSPPKVRKAADGRQHHQQRSGGGLLLGCGSAKAVNVAPSAHCRVQEIKAEAAARQVQRQRHKSMDAIRYHAETRRSVD